MRVLNFTVEFDGRSGDVDENDPFSPGLAVVKLEGTEILRLPVDYMRAMRVGEDEAAVEAVTDWVKDRLNGI